jgi:phosphoribosylpyrophosphate synthetase
MSVNDALMELLITCYACKTSSARKIIGVVPYLPYSKQSKMRNRGSIPSRLIADLLCGAGSLTALVFVSVFL